jgi:hypothetical protein
MSVDTGLGWEGLIDDRLRVERRTRARPRED